MQSVEELQLKKPRVQSALLVVREKNFAGEHSIETRGCQIKSSRNDIDLLNFAKALLMVKTN